MQKVVIFGAGNCGRLIGANLMQDKNVEIIAFIDNNSQKAGQRIYFENTQDSVVGNFDNTDSKAEGFFDDFACCADLSARSYLSGSAEARKSNSSKSTEKPTPHNHGGGVSVYIPLLRF